MATTQEKQERNWALLCHLSAFAGYVMPFGNIFGPLLIWLLKKDESPLVDYHGKESLNFQISLTIYALVGAFLLITIIGIPLGMLLLLFAVIAQIVLVIVAAVKVSSGEEYRYPFTIRFIN